MFIAGGLFATGFAFKSVAAIFPVATCMWLALRAGESRSLRRRVLDVLGIGSGFAFFVVIPAAYFWMTGRGHFYLEWYVRVPLQVYEGTSEWFPKVWTKLLWFIAVLTVTAVLALRSRTRRLLEDGWAVLGATIVGVASLLPLYKSQASHYFYPAAAFLLPVASAVFLAAFKRDRGRRGRRAPWSQWAARSQRSSL